MRKTVLLYQNRNKIIRGYFSRVMIGLFSTIFMLSCRNNKVEYHQNLELVWENQLLEWNASSLVFDDGFIYGHTLNDSIFKLNFVDGEIVWMKYSQGAYSSLGPLVHDNRIFFGGAKTLKSYDKEGRLIWSVLTNKKTTGLSIKDSVIYNVRRGEGLFANDIYSGKELWNLKPNYQMLTASGPTIKDSLLIIGNFDYKEGEGNHLTCISINDKSVKWQLKNNGYFNNSAVIQDNYVIINSDSAYVKGYTYKVDLQSGNVLWRTETNPVLFYQSKIMAENVFVPSYDDGIYCLNMEDGEVMWKLTDEYYPDSELLLYDDILYFGTTSREFVGVNSLGKIIFTSKFEYGIGNPFVYNQEVYVNDGKGRLFKKNIK